MNANSLSRLLPTGSLTWGLQGVLLRTASVPVHQHSCAPSSGERVQRAHECSLTRCYATAQASGASTTASASAPTTSSSGAAPTQGAAGGRSAAAAQPAAASRAAGAGAGAGAGDARAAPFYAGLAARYPDPDTVPDAMLHRLRNSLFGRAVRPREATGRRALARPLQGKALTDWYWMPPNQSPGFHSEEDEYELRRALNRRHTKEAEAEAADAGGGKKKKK